MLVPLKLLLQFSSAWNTNRCLRSWVDPDLLLSINATL